MSNAFEFTDANFEEETATGVSLVDFWAPWCAPCRMQGPIIEKIAGDFEGKAKIGKLNVDEHPMHAGGFGVTGIPTVIILKDGKEAARFVGLQSEQGLVSKIQSLL